MEKTIAAFFSEMNRLGRSKNTIDGYAVDLRQFTRFCGPKLERESFSGLAKEFLTGLTEQAPRTVRRKRAALKSLANLPDSNLTTSSLREFPSGSPRPCVITRQRSSS